MSELHFTWDPEKAKENAKKHSVAFEEGDRLF